MTNPPDNDATAALAELVKQLLQEKHDARQMLAAFGRGEISSDQIVAQLAAQYQTGIGGAVRALAEHDKAAAKQLGERLRDRLDSFLSELGAGEPPPQPRPARTVRTDGFKDRDDDVLLREYVMLKTLTRSDEPVRSAAIFTAVKALLGGVGDEAITAHLVRLQKADIIGKERKGRYHGIARSQTHLAALEAEIEARGLRLPAA
jgi:hypothetical protein